MGCGILGGIKTGSAGGSSPGPGPAPKPQGQGSWKRNGEMTKRTKYAKVELRDPDGATMNDISSSWEHTIGCDGDQEMVFELGSGSTLTIKIV